jgi:hypothetical protein
MSHEFVDHPVTKNDHPSQAVQDEAAKIIAKLDGVPGSQWNIDRPDYDTARALQARQMLIHDSQTLSPKDMKDLLLTVMNGEDKKKGYDVEIYGHSTAEVREKQEKIDSDRNNLGMLMANCPTEDRKAAFKTFNQTHDLEMANFKQELIVELTHHSTPGEYGEKGRTPGATISVAPYRIINGLPDFKVVDQSKS